jgi:hypothetical protein
MEAGILGWEIAVEKRGGKTRWEIGLEKSGWKIRA